jgi:hypothetical protein
MTALHVGCQRELANAGGKGEGEKAETLAPGQLGDGQAGVSVGADLRVRG